MVGGRGTNYNNQAVEVLKKAAADSIKDGEAVWFGCDVGKHFHGKLGINDMDVFNHELVFGISVKNLSKAERLIFGDSLMTHAMVLTAVTDKFYREHVKPLYNIEDKVRHTHTLTLTLSPLQFYREHVKPLYNIEDKVRHTHTLTLTLSPLQFYREHVKPLYNIEDKVRHTHTLTLTLSPLQFYREHVKPLYNIEDKVRHTHTLTLTLSPLQFYREHVKPLYNIEDKVRHTHTLTLTLSPLQFYREHVKPLYNIEDKVRHTHTLTLTLSPLQFYREHVKPLYNIEDKVRHTHTLTLTLSPLQFYREHVKPLYNIEDKLYGVEFLGNMVGGRGTNYNNQAVEVLKKAAADSIKDGEAVWFGCDVGKHFHGKLGINDMDVFNHELVFGISVKNLSKAERLIFGDSLMTHAMVLTAVTDKIQELETENTELKKQVQEMQEQLMLTQVCPAGSVTIQSPSTDIFDMVPFSPASPVSPAPASNGTQPPALPRRSNETKKDLFGAEPFDPFICGEADFPPDIQSKLDEMQKKIFLALNHLTPLSVGKQTFHQTSSPSWTKCR
ncbi:UNVERIFIED_CONTAM: hypothetical protein FKN15_064730 [Acipenser sinensis]